MPALELVIDDQKVQFDRYDHITVTGEFDKWQHEKYILRYDDTERAFKVRIPYSGEEELIFKFVLNGTLWTTVDCFDAIMDPQGHINNRVFCRDWLREDEDAAAEAEHVKATTNAEQVRTPEEPLQESEMSMDDVTIASPEQGLERSTRLQDVFVDGAEDIGGSSSGSSSVSSREQSRNGSALTSTDGSVGASADGRGKGASAEQKTSGAQEAQVADEYSEQSTYTKKPILSFPGDYIHVASRGELSSSEDVELSPTVTGEEDLRYTPDPGENRSRLQGLLSSIRVFKTFWKG